MRMLIIVVLIIALLTFAGWLVFNVGDSSTTIEIRTDKMQQDTEQAVDKVKEAVEKIGEGDTVDELESAGVDREPIPEP